MKKFLSLAINAILICCLLVTALRIQTARASPVVQFVPDSYPTIQGAIDHAGLGDLIMVRAGTYFENIIINHTVTLVSFNVDAESTIIDGNNTGTVVYVAADNVYVAGFTIRHSGGFPFSGFKVESSGICNIRSDVFIDNYNAITLNNCSRCLIFNNTIGQTAVDGVAVVGSHDNTVGNNSITGCGNQGVELDLASYNNKIRSNIFTENAGGILIVDSHENTVSNNTVERNMIGVWLQHSYRNSIYQNQLSSNAIGLSIIYADSTLNRIYHNNIVSNNQSQAETPGSMGNWWDNGYPSGGNYWSDYNGTDLHSGVYQNETGSDGLGDTPYVVNSNNPDNYPFMKPYIEVLPVLTIEPQNLTVRPYENFTVTIMLHNVTRDNVPAGLVGLELALIWNTTLTEPLSFVDGVGKTDGVFNGTSLLYAAQSGFYSEFPDPSGYPIPEPGPYTSALCYFAAVVSISTNGWGNEPWWGDGVVANITFLANNTVTSPTNSTLQMVSTFMIDNDVMDIAHESRNGTVQIQPESLSCDLNFDGRVNLADLTVVASAYHSRPGDPKWNPTADVAAPFGNISLSDLVTVAVHYGQHRP